MKKKASKYEREIWDIPKTGGGNEWKMNLKLPHAWDSHMLIPIHE